MRIVLSLVLGVLLFSALAGCGRLGYRDAGATESTEQRQARELNERVGALDSRLAIDTKELSLTDRIDAQEIAGGVAINWEGSLLEQIHGLADYYHLENISGPLVVQVDQLDQATGHQSETGGSIQARIDALKKNFDEQNKATRASQKVARLERYLDRVEKLEKVLSMTSEQKDVATRITALEAQLMRDTDPRGVTLRNRLAKLEALAGI